MKLSSLYIIPVEAKPTPKPVLDTKNLETKPFDIAAILRKKTKGIAKPLFYKEITV